MGSAACRSRTRGKDSAFQRFGGYRRRNASWTQRRLGSAPFLLGLNQVPFRLDSFLVGCNRSLSRRISLPATARSAALAPSAPVDHQLSTLSPQLTRDFPRKGPARLHRDSHFNEPVACLGRAYPLIGLRGRIGQGKSYWQLVRYHTLNGRSRGGIQLGLMVSSIARALPGTRRINLRRSSRISMELTEGGVRLKNRAKSA